MGTTFSTIQMRNNFDLEPELFKKSLSKYFKKRGLTIATEEDFQFSYRLAFSDKSNWVTLSCSEYESDVRWLQEDAQGLAKAFKTYCIVTSVIDSDVLCLNLFGSTDKQRDVINLGHLDYGIPESKGNQKLWEPLLSEGTTWEQIMEIYNGEYTFIEDSLVDIAPLLGMDPRYITSDYGYWDDTGEDNSNVVDLYLKKAQTSSKKRGVSLLSAFKQIFGEALEPLGFVKIKGRQPYFVRLIGDEIIHVVTFRNESRFRDIKAFNILGGVATVYRRIIDLKDIPMHNINWLETNFRFYVKSNPDDDSDFSRSIYDFSHKADDDESMVNAVKYALEITEQFMLPRLDKVTDLNSCIEFFREFHSSFLVLYDDEDFGQKYGDSYEKEGLLLIKANNRNDYIEEMEKNIARDSQWMKEGKFGFSEKEFEERCESIRQGRFEQLAIRDRMFDDLEWYKKIMKELERRKKDNIERLRSYGLNI